MEKKIVRCLIEKERFENIVSVVYDDHTDEVIGSYYPDELSYSVDEFIGLTRKQAIDLMTVKDITYLRS